MPADSLSLAPLNSSLPEGAMDGCDPSANPNLRDVGAPSPTVKLRDKSEFVLSLRGQR